MRIINSFVTFVLIIASNLFAAQEAGSRVLKNTQYFMIHTSSGCSKYFLSSAGNRSLLKECRCSDVDKSKLRFEDRVLSFYTADDKKVDENILSGTLPFLIPEIFAQQLDPQCKPKAAHVKVQRFDIFFINNKNEYIHSTKPYCGRSQLDKKQVEECRQFVEFDEEIAQKLLKLNIDFNSK